MKRKLTGRNFTPIEFNRLAQCVQCGIAGLLQAGEKCEECKILDIPKCEICDIVLRKGVYKQYAYDIKEDYRTVDYKVNKSSVREFFYYKEYYRKSDKEGLCVDCIDWEYQMRNKCWLCKKNFTNTKENYKYNGNMCSMCGLQFN